MSQKKALFNEDSDEEEETFKINQAYATKYEEWRRGEELQKLKDRYGEDGILSSDSETSSDDDFVEPDNPEFDHDFLVTLGALHKKNEVDLEGNNFFSGNYSSKKKEKEEKAMTIRDYERHIIMDRGGELDDKNDLLMGDYGERQVDRKAVTFDNDDDESSDDDGDGLLSSGLFRVRKSTQEKKKEETTKDVEDAVAFVKGESSAVRNPKDKNLLEGLRDAWRDPNLSKDDKWLADFFLNKRYLEDDDEAIERAYNETVIDEETLSEDEKTLEKMETFETKYRFRYEEPDDEFIKKHPRIIPDSVRASDDRRKLKRKALKQRKQEEKELKRQEIQKLKALKYKEIEAKVEKIKEASGNMDIDLGDKELEEDFDPAAHDHAMSRMFGDDYYEVDDGNTEKPVFSDDEDIIKDYDDWMEKQGPNFAGGDTGSGEDEYEGAHWEGLEDFNMDADYDPSEAKEALQQEMVKASNRKKCRRKSKFAKAVARKKPVFDPEEKNFDSYYDEYYQLDFEDIVGGIPCRFKYRKVESNNFGLSTEEILTAQDRELNRWYSLKKMFKYQRTQEEEHIDRCKYKNRASQLHVKQKILSSLFVKDPEELQIKEEEKKREKNYKKKLRRQQKLQDNVKHSINTFTSEDIKIICDESKLEASNKESPDMNREPFINEMRDVQENSLNCTENLQTIKLNVLASETTNDSNNIKLSKDESEEWPKKKKKRKKERDPGYDNLDFVENKMIKTFDTNVEEESSILPFEDVCGKWPKKKKKKAVGQDELDTFNDRNSSGSNEGGCSISKKQKKASMNGVTDSPEKDTANINYMNEAVSVAVNLKKKKKNKKYEEKVPAKRVDKKKKPLNSNCDIPFFQGISDSRLAAYGENPKKLKNKVKYGKRDL